MGQMSVEQSRRNQALFPQLKTPKVAFRNLHNLKFEEVGKQWGFDGRNFAGDGLRGFG